MVKLLPTVSIAFFIGALGLGYVRNRVASIPRVSLADQVEMNLSKPGGKQWIKILERANISDAVPTFAFENLIRVGAKGFYPNRPGGPPMHRHLYADEQFEVLSGTIGYSLNGKEGTAGKGAVLKLPVGSEHTFWNADTGNDLHFVVRVTNRNGHPMAYEQYFENLAGLAQHYGHISKINPLQQLLTAKAAGIVYTFMPVPAIRFVLCPLAELLGYKGLYPEYRSAAP